MSRAPEGAARRLFTVAEYHRMAETGILGTDDRVELVRGVVRRMSPKSWAHVVAAGSVYDQLRDALRGRASVYHEAPLVVERLDSEPEPDVLVCSNPDRSAYRSRWTRPLLVVEVADSSLEFDLREKAWLYAEAQVPEYWVVNLVERHLVVFRDPRLGGYSIRTSFDESARVTPESWPDLSFEVSALLPPSTPAPG